MGKLSRHGLKLGLRGAGQYRQTVHSAALELAPQRFAEDVGKGLGGAVERVEGERLRSRDRADDDQGAAPPLAHPGEQAAGEQSRGHAVELDHLAHPLPVLTLAFEPGFGNRQKRLTFFGFPEVKEIGL